MISGDYLICPLFDSFMINWSVRMSLEVLSQTTRKKLFSILKFCYPAK